MTSDDEFTRRLIGFRLSEKEARLSKGRTKLRQWCARLDKVGTVSWLKPDWLGDRSNEWLRKSRNINRVKSPADPPLFV